MENISTQKQITQDPPSFSEEKNINRYGENEDIGLVKRLSERGNYEEAEKTGLFIVLFTGLITYSFFRVVLSFLGNSSQESIL